MEAFTVGRAYDEVFTQDHTTRSPLALVVGAADAEAPSQLAADIGEIVAARRADLQISAAELAGLAGVAEADVALIEGGRGSLSLGALEKILAPLQLRISLTSTL
jgi:hypothetical protein